MPINCYAAMAAKEKLQPFKYEPKPLGADEIEVKISHCGFCHSDLHLIDNDWQFSQYPLVPGHEIIGTITALGTNVQNLKMGQRVGIGWQSNSCGQCEWCLQTKDNLCPTQQATCVGNFGGFAEFVRVNNRFAFVIPETLSSETAAPMLCGGITVFSPLKQHITNSNMRVGIIGIGGLGHMALQFAHALGCEVVAFSSNPTKEKEAKKFGAHELISSVDKNALSKVANSFDFILSTATANLNWGAYLAALRPLGKLCIVGVPALQISVPLFNLIGGRKTICGSNIGSSAEIKEMLEFAAKNGIHAQTEVIEMSQVNAAVDKVRSNQARYRMVLKNS